MNIQRFDQVITADAVVVGAGVAGLSAALGMAPKKVLLVTKTALGDGSTRLAQGGIAAAVGPDDSPSAHAADTIAVGAGLNDVGAVSVLTGEGPDRILDLVAAGARFDRGEAGEFRLGREAGHGARRILHADGDATGAEVSRALTAAVLAASHVTVVEGCFATDLIVDAGRVAGTACRTGDGSKLALLAPAVVLATGGIGRLYEWTTNPPEVTGDGAAMAHRAGARLADMEFVQFHPTALATGRDPMSLLTEAIRGEGALLVDEEGTRFMTGVHADAELAPRDVVARAIWRQQATGHRVWLDARAVIGSAFPDKFPTVFGLCSEDGIDPRTDLMPVSPAAHYHMGGIATSLDGRSSLPGLWAAGEVTRTGVHGANRLASNSLLEGLVFGRRVGDSIAVTVGTLPGRSVDLPDPGTAPDRQPDTEMALRTLMWENAGLVRDGIGLAFAVDEIDRLEEKIDPAPSELRNMVEAAALVARAALARTESRGGHYRSDYPATDQSWSGRADS
ncbi:L-aspartate oxidase [bacterium]|nr:L-aspartate oxidase [bacterium]